MQRQLRRLYTTALPDDPDEEQVKVALDRMKLAWGFKLHTTGVETIIWSDTRYRESDRRICVRVAELFRSLR